MTFGFLFWLFLSGLVVASLQDLKRREVDDWLNLLIFFSGVSFLMFGAFNSGNFKIILYLVVFSVLIYALANLFYYGRVFAGGDAKLLVALTPLFVSITFFGGLSNLLLFLFLLMICGSVYGLIYSLVLYFRDFEKVNKEMKVEFAKYSWMKYALVLGLGLLLISIFELVFIFLAVLVLSFPLLHVFAKCLERVSMVKTISGKELREGDWLVKDVLVGERVVKSTWDGLTFKDLKLLKRSRKVKIKEGIPFVPAFLLAFLIYSFYGMKILEIFLNLF